jgi:hypothetical protein
MKRHLTISAMALIALSGCTDDGTGVAADDIAGIWTAASAVFTSVADPTMSEDAIAQGLTFTATLGADDTYTTVVTAPNEPTETESGTYAVSGSTLTLTPTDVQIGPETFTIVRTGDSMTLTASDNEWAFDGNDVEEAATLVMNLTR